MFAYCPTVSHRVCGVSLDDSIEEMRMNATERKQSVTTTSMKYIPTITQEDIGVRFREYDFCHYHVFKNASVDNSNGDKNLTVRFTKKTNMSVYIYEGTARNSARRSGLVNPGYDDVIPVLAFVNLGLRYFRGTDRGNILLGRRRQRAGNIIKRLSERGTPVADKFGQAEFTSRQVINQYFLNSVNRDPTRRDTL